MISAMLDVVIEVEIYLNPVVTVKCKLMFWSRSH